MGEVKDKTDRQEARVPINMRATLLALVQIIGCFAASLPPKSAIEPQGRVETTTSTVTSTTDGITSTVTTTTTKTTTSSSSGLIECPVVTNAEIAANLGNALQVFEDRKAANEMDYGAADVAKFLLKKAEETPDCTPRNLTETQLPWITDGCASSEWHAAPSWDQSPQLVQPLVVLWVLSSIVYFYDHEDLSYLEHLEKHVVLAGPWEEAVHNWYYEKFSSRMTSFHLTDLDGAPALVFAIRGSASNRNWATEILREWVTPLRLYMFARALLTVGDCVGRAVQTFGTIRSLPTGSARGVLPRRDSLRRLTGSEKERRTRTIARGTWTSTQSSSLPKTTPRIRWAIGSTSLATHSGGPWQISPRTTTTT